VSVTAVPLAKLALHVAPQLIPAGLLVTVPEPVPAVCTVSVSVGVILNVAVTELAAVSVTLQAPVPVQAPDHPANVDPALAVGVSVTAVPLAKPALHVVGQLIPAGLLVTVPEPVPAVCTVSVTEGAMVLLKVAVTAVAAFTVTTHVPVPEHAPDHPANVDPVPAAAVSVTVVPPA
jgi:hypothetical protein